MPRPNGARSTSDARSADPWAQRPRPAIAVHVNEPCRHAPEAVPRAGRLRIRWCGRDARDGAPPVRRGPRPRPGDAPHLHRSWRSDERHPGNAITRSPARPGERLDRPKVMLVVSAHGPASGRTLVATHPRPDTIHDIGGFPGELQQVRQPAPGASEAARKAAGMATGLKVHKMELDHGAWKWEHQASVASPRWEQWPNRPAPRTATTCRCSTWWGRQAPATFRRGSMPAWGGAASACGA